MRSRPAGTPSPALRPCPFTRAHVRCRVRGDHARVGCIAAENPNSYLLPCLGLGSAIRARTQRHHILLGSVEHTGIFILIDALKACGDALTGSEALPFHARPRPLQGSGGPRARRLQRC